MAKAKLSTTSVLVAIVEYQNKKRDMFKAHGIDWRDNDKIFSRIHAKDICKISNSTAAYHLEKLVSQGMLTKEKSKPAHCYSWWEYTITDAGYKLANESFGVSTNERK